MALAVSVLSCGWFVKQTASCGAHTEVCEMQFAQPAATPLSGPCGRHLGTDCRRHQIVLAAPIISLSSACMKQQAKKQYYVMKLSKNRKFTSVFWPFLKPASETAELRA